MPTPEASLINGRTAQPKTQIPVFLTSIGPLVDRRCNPLHYDESEGQGFDGVSQLVRLTDRWRE